MTNEQKSSDLSFCLNRHRHNLQFYKSDFYEISKRLNFDTTLTNAQYAELLNKIILIKNCIDTIEDLIKDIKEEFKTLNGIIHPSPQY